MEAQRSLLVEAWEQEPPALRFAIACLAALLVPGSSVPVGDIRGMARQHGDTQVGWCLELAAALLTDDDVIILRTARAIAPWAHGVSPGAPTSFGVSVRIFAMHVLAKAAPYAITS